MNTDQAESNRSIYADILLKEHESILVALCGELRQKIPSAKVLDEVSLRNCFPIFLKTMVQILSTNEFTTGHDIFKENIRSSRLHGESRSKVPSYTLDQVILEFRILRRLIFSVLEVNGPVPPVERDKIFFAIDNGVTQAATEFTILRGFSDARISEERLAKSLALDQVNDLQNSLGKLKNESKQREHFVSAITHDMRNPLSVARASAEYIEAHPGNVKTVRKFAKKIRDSVDRANQMIIDLLDSYRIKSGEKLPLHIKYCDIVPLIRGVQEDLEDVYGNQLKVIVPEHVRGDFDETGIRRALENLITNAIKYGSRTTVTLGIEQSDSETMITVHNKGNPIPPEDISKLFDHYHRSEGAKQSGQQGWGIGLTLVKGIAEAHGGKVVVTSSEEAGTTFRMVFPRYVS